MTAPKARTFRKAFIAVHAVNRYRNSMVYRDMSLAEAKKRNAAVLQEGEPTLVAVDAIRAVLTIKEKVGGTHEAKTKSGQCVTTHLEDREIECALLQVMGTNPIRTRETVAEVRALIATATAEAAL